MKNQAFFIDAKQRAVFQRGGIICAEPSPDALSALAASQGLSVATPAGTTVGQSFSIAEAAGAIGLRTQSIQLMRDHMYRICEGYSSGAISGLAFQLLHRRFQTTMVGILAIEQLTGAVRPPAIVLGGSAGIGDAQAITALTAEHEGMAKSVAQAQTALKAAQGLEKTAKDELAAANAVLAAVAAGDAAGLKTAQKQVDDAREKAERASANVLDADRVVVGRQLALSAIDRRLVLARSSGSASAGGVIEAQRAASIGDMATISATVGQIVKDTMNLTNQNDFCVMALAEATGPQSTLEMNNPIVRDCRAIFHATPQPAQMRVPG